MKKLFLSITLLLLAATSLFAVRAKQGICQLQLVDGTIVSATLHGDENFHYYTLLDGTPLREATNGKYQMTSQEELENEFFCRPSQNAANHDSNFRSIESIKHR